MKNLCSYAFRRGVTMIELLVTLLIISVIMTGVYNLLEASWNAYTTVVWQNTVNREAHRALDDICDTVRSSGNDLDMTTTFKRSGPLTANIYNGTHLHLAVKRKDGGYNYYPSIQGNGTNVLVRNDGGTEKTVAQYITDVHFAYEYRNVSQNDASWTFSNVNSIIDVNTGQRLPSAYLVKTVYVTVTASYQPYPNGQTYTRTLHSAVTLRMPYNTPLPLSQQNGS